MLILSESCPDVNGRILYKNAFCFLCRKTTPPDRISLTGSPEFRIIFSQTSKEGGNNMNPTKPTRAAIVMAAAIAVLGIAMVLFLYFSGMVPGSAPPGTGVTLPTSGDSLQEEELEYMPDSFPVLARMSVAGSNTTRFYNYYYDPYGQLLREAWNNGVIIDYAYYENGNPKSEVKYSGENSLYAREYREDGTLALETEYLRYADGTLSSTTVYQYDEKGNLCLYRDSDADGEFHTTIHYNNEYDSYDRLIRQDTVREDGTLLHTDLWDYHESGWILDSTEYNGDPDDNPVWRHEIQTYDADGRILSIRCDISDMYPSRDHRIFTYDDQGNLIREEWVMYPMGNDDYICYVTEQENTYENGFLVRRESVFRETSSFEGEITETPPSAPQVETWEYDAEGNLLSHHDGTSFYFYTYLPLEEVLLS